MKNIAKKIAIIGMCSVLCVGGAFETIYALNTNKDNEAENSKNNELTANSESENKAPSKDETVYVIAGADGSVQKVIVSDWLKNPTGENGITDDSILSNIENVKGDESYTIDPDNMKVWDAAGSDIYYQGNSDKELPVNMNITYMLDGKTISAEALAGKSGKVTIRFDYKNNQYEMVEIDGQKEKIYVPFAMLTGMILDNDVFTNVEVSNGKVINDGDRTVVIGMALPGLADNLKLTEDKFNIPDYVEITADAKDFCWGMTVTVATNELFNKIDTDKINSVDDVDDMLAQVTDAMSQLLDGSSALYDGLCTLLDKSGDLVAGINKLSEGAKALQEGAGNLVAGANSLSSGAATLNAGVKELSDGLNTLASNNAALTAGAKQVFDTLLATADSQLAAAGLTVPKLTIENYETVLNQVMAMLPDNSAPKAQLAALKGSLDNYKGFYNGVLTYTAGVANAATGAATINAGAAALSTGAGTLAAGSAELKKGIDELAAGIFTLKDGTPTLVGGITALKDGAMQLNSGLNQFNEEAIGKIVGLVDGDIAGLITRAKATVDVSNNYQNYAGIGEMDGAVRFVYRTASIEK